MGAGRWVAQDAAENKPTRASPRHNAKGPQGLSNILAPYMRDEGLRCLPAGLKTDSIHDDNDNDTDATVFQIVLQHQQG